MTTARQAPDGQPVTIPHWDAIAREWRTITVLAEPVNRSRRRRRRARQAPAARMPLTSDSSPIPNWWRDTAFAPGEPLADLRTYIEPASMRTHRAATVMPADPGRITATR